MKTKTEWKSVLPNQRNNLSYWVSKSDGSIWNTTTCDFRWVNCFGKEHAPCGSLRMNFDGKIIGDE